MLQLFGFFQESVRAFVDFLFSLFACVIQNYILDTFDAVKEVCRERSEFRAVFYAAFFQFPRRNKRNYNADCKETYESHEREIPTRNKPYEQEHSRRYKHGNADGRNGMRIENFKRFDVRSYHRYDTALLFAFKFRGAKNS